MTRTRAIVLSSANESRLVTAVRSNTCLPEDSKAVHGQDRDCRSRRNPANNIGHLPHGSAAAQSSFIQRAALAPLELASALYVAFCLGSCSSLGEVVERGTA